jgi:hypothetical protein
MRRFVIKVLVFIFLTIIIFAVLLFLLPPTPRASKSLLFAEIKKDSLLINKQSPRIIFVGGSNLSFGLNSQMIKDSLRLHPVNTAIHASIGMKYMLENTLQYVKESDIFVLAPEYDYFYREWDYGSEELMRMILDVNKKNIRLLSLRQMINCTPFIGNLVLSKFDKFEYLNIVESDVYSVNSFNQYGDVYTHWDMQKRKFKPYVKINIAKYNPEVMEGIKTISKKMQEKGASVFISYPGLQDSSFLNSKESIKKVEKEYIANDFILLGTPERYMMLDSFMFNTPYHLNKKGMDYRTKLLIEDLRAEILKQK